MNAMTVDVEDYFQVSAFENNISRAEWDNIQPRVEQNTDRILTLFDFHNVHATFFILGWIAERFPGLIRRIQEAGHEIGMSLGVGLSLAAEPGLLATKIRSI